jgi:hypothetical protein
MHDSDDTLTRFERRFRAIEGQIPSRSFEALLLRARPRSRYARPSLAVAAAIVLIAALIVVPPALRRSASSAPGSASPTPAVSVEPSPTARAITIGEGTWTVMCNGTSDANCDGAVGLFANNLGWSWKVILDESGGDLAVQPRACPTFNGLTARQCWDVTAVRPSGPFCTVVAHDANDPRYPDYFEIGGQDGTGRAGGPPDGWPMCVVPAVVICGTSPTWAVISCEPAVQAGVGSLPAQHPQFVRIEFAYGGSCSPAAIGGLNPRIGAVIFRAVAGAQDFCVAVVQDDIGTISVVGPVQPYPS